MRPSPPKKFGSSLNLTYLAHDGLGLIKWMRARWGPTQNEFEIWIPEFPTVFIAVPSRNSEELLLSGPRSAGGLPLPRAPVMFLPGGMTPAEFAFSDLLKIIGNEVNPIFKNYELFASDSPPTNWSVSAEVDSIIKVASSSGVQQFHVVGYSLGADIGLALAAEHPELLRSLALIEPDWIGSAEELTPSERALREEIRAAAREGRFQDQMRDSARLVLAPGVTPPSPGAGPPPPWMAKRIAAAPIMPRLYETPLDLDRLRALSCPVYVAVGELSSEHIHRVARALAEKVPDCKVQVYPRIHHFAPPHREATESLALDLRDLWGRAATKVAKGVRSERQNRGSGFSGHGGV